MNEIKDYKVIWGNSINQINKSVNSSIQDGWTPLGGIAIKDQIDPNDTKRIPEPLFWL